MNPTSSDATIQRFATSIGRQVGQAVAAAIVKHGTHALDTLSKGAGQVLARRHTSYHGLPQPKLPAKAKVVKTPAKPPAKVKAAPAKPTATTRAHGEKRASGEIEKLADRFLRLLAASPGLTMEKLAVQLAVPTKDLQLPLARLRGQNSRGQQVAVSRIRSEGQKRATRYFVATPEEGAVTPVPTPAPKDPAPESNP